MAKPPDQMTRPELIELVRELRAGESERALRRTILELQVFREELRQQNEELIRAQRELEWSRDRYVELFDTAPVGYVTFDDKGVVEEMNLTGARMLGSEPVRLVESGPAGGAILARTVAESCGADRAMSFDMGGTTAKICFIDDYEPELSRSFEFGRMYRFLKGSGLPIRIPVIEMVEIGAGGGSIARVDEMQRVHRTLWEAGFLAPLIAYPGGPSPMYFRLMVSAQHTPAQIEAFGRSLSEAIEGHGPVRRAAG